MLNSASPLLLSLPLFSYYRIMSYIFIKDNDVYEGMSAIKAEGVKGVSREVLEDFARIYLTERDRKDIEERKERIRKRLVELPTGEGRRAFIESQIRLQTFSLETHRRKELVSLELLDFLMGLYEKERGGREEE